MQQQLTAEQREELRYSLPDAFMELDRSFHRAAGRLEQDEAGDIKVNEGRFTRCEPGNNNWQVGSR